MIPLLLACCNAAWSQEDLKAKYKDAEAVYTNLNCDVTIKRENGKLVALREYSEDLLYLTSNSVQMMSRGQIYHSSFNVLQRWDAYTQLPSEKKKLKVSNTTTSSSRQDYIFYDDGKETSFDFTGGMIGATRHLEYQILNSEIHLLSPYYFERYFPVVAGELRISFPSDVKLKYIAKGLHASKISFSESQKKDRTTYTFRIADLTGSRHYEDAPDNSYYATHLIFYVEQVKENGEWKNFLSSPDDLYRHNYEYIKNINKTPSDELKHLADSLTRGAGSEREKARRIYKWVQTHVKYVAFEDGMEGFIPREANLVCSRRFGDCKDMASVLTAMLNHAGVKAYFTWIGTRDIPYDYTEVPLPIVDNHMICTIKTGDEYIFLDGTDHSCIFGRAPSALQGKQAMISISEKEYKIVRVPVIPKEQNTMLDSTFLELTDKGIKGRVSIRLKGYNASDVNSILGYRNGEERTDFFKGYFGRGSNKIRFSNWAFTTNEEKSELHVTADLELPDYAKKLADEWYVNLNLIKLFEHQEIDFPKRMIPIEIPYLSQETYVTTLKIPEGYKVAYMPKGENFKNDVWGFVMKYTSDNNAIHLTQQFNREQLMLQREQFEPWNKVLEHLFPHYKQTISLRKN